MAVRTEVKVEFADRGPFKTTALINTGFETTKPQLLLPVKAAEVVGLWPINSRALL